MSNATESPVEIEQPIEDKPKPPFYRQSGCLSCFQSITIFLFTIHLIYSSYELHNVREKNEELRSTLWDTLLRLDEYTKEDVEKYLNDGKPPYLVREFEDEFSGAEGVAFSPDGQTLVSGHFDKVLLWEVQTGDVIHTFSTSDDLYRVVAFSPDGQTIASGALTGPILLWSVATGDIVQTLDEQTESPMVVSLSFSPDGRYLLAGQVWGQAALWGIEETHPIRVYAEKNYALAVAFSPNGQFFVMGGWDGSASLWDVQTGEQIRTFPGHTDDVISVAFSPDGRYVLTGSRDETAILFEANSGAIAQVFQGHEDNINCVAFSPDGNFVLTGSDDETAILWDVQTGDKVRTFDTSLQKYGGGHIDTVAFSPDGQYVVTGGFGGLLLWESGIGVSNAPPSADEVRD